MKVLVIDSNRATVASLFSYLEASGHRMDVALDDVTGLHLATSNHYDALIVGWATPRIDGPSLIKRLRRHYNVSVPALMLTDRTEICDKVVAFRSGADDYLTMPFEPAELEVRLEALVARSRGTVTKRRLIVGNLTLDLSTLEVTRGGTVVRLYPACRKLLEMLMRESPSAVSREQLEYAVWGSDPPDQDLLRSHMSSLRRNVDSPFEEKLIQTVPRFGYRLVACGSVKTDTQDAVSIAAGN